jgi:hypothetical protein
VAYVCLTLFAISLLSRDIIRVVFYAQRESELTNDLSFSLGRVKVDLLLSSGSERV